MKVGYKNKPALQVFFRLKVDLMCGWVFVSFFSVSFDEDHKRAIGILLKAMALFKLSMNENKTQNDSK